MKTNVSKHGKCKLFPQSQNLTTDRNSTTEEFPHELNIEARNRLSHQRADHRNAEVDTPDCLFAFNCPKTFPTKRPRLQGNRSQEARKPNSASTETFPGALELCSLLLSSLNFPANPTPSSPTQQNLQNPLPTNTKLQQRSLPHGNWRVPRFSSRLLGHAQRTVPTERTSNSGLPITLPKRVYSTSRLLPDDPSTNQENPQR